MTKMMRKVDKRSACGKAAWQPYPLIFIAACLLNACASTPETHFYVLSALSLPAHPMLSAAPKRLLGLGPVTVPALLERKQIITRTGSNSITSSEFHQWAAPLKESITETLTQNLSVLLPNDIIKAYPWSAYGEMDFHVIIDIVRFEASASQTAELTANWLIMNDKTLRPIKHGRAKITHLQVGSNPADAVEALSQTLQEFSKQLADTLLTTLNSSASGKAGGG